MMAASTGAWPRPLIVSPSASAYAGPTAITTSSGASSVNAAGYALGHPVAPVPTMLDNYARAKLIVRTTLLHAREAAEVVRSAPPVEVELL